ncbi:EAL domain-containing protein [Noviherbaspirillum sp. CPCC 100848]|uniref:EAL domain-containing protein n=1 Tax=Noviherbaspirillum album TaxID=3080276 RepID=A0ABU6J2B6_9BURK|nr:EAL domain-containing protein [Noviherbaspirillum sp. CPCC 100848]MEC4717754.1 EAL domain-containing protein [Noviherbaspirillum sp. CPCC 100848]
MLHRNRMRSPGLAAAATFVLGFMTTIALFFFTFELESDKANLDFRRRAESYIADVQQGLGDAIASLQAVNQLFAAVGEVSREEFHTFTLPLLQRQPYIEAFTYHRFVAATERKRFEAAMRRDFPGFRISEYKDRGVAPAGPRDMYLPTVYISPQENNEVRIGNDALFHPQRAAAAWRAVDSARPSATGIVQLLMADNPEPTFFVIMPLYRRDMPLGSPEERRRAMFGVTQAVFNSKNLVSKILGKEALSMPGIDISISTAVTPEDKHLAFQHHAEVENPDEPQPGFLRKVLEPPMLVGESFDVGGTVWHVQVSGSSSAFIYSHRGSLLVLLFGMLVTLYAANNRRAAANRERKIEQLVEQRTAELRLTSEDLQLRQSAIEASANAIIIVSARRPHFSIEYVNPAFEKISGYSAEDVIGKPFAPLARPGDDQTGVADLRAALHAGTQTHAIVSQTRRDGSQFWSDVYVAPVSIHSGEVSHFVITQYDITEMRRYQGELEFQANYDLLTGIANRNLLRDRVTQALTMAARHGELVCVAFMDLDRFKFVNDSMGHRAGDLVLKSIASRLKRAVRDTDTVARYGGDEFVLVLPESEDVTESAKVVQRVMQALARPVPVDGKDFFPTCSVGIAVYPTDGEDFETLLTHADIAMYSAKEKGRNNFQFYAPRMHERAAKRLRLEGDLRRALERQELTLYYQPQVDVNTGRVVGAETLIRWQHPELGLIPPSEFVALAEETGLIGAIGEWVLRTACTQAKKWEQAGLGKLRIAINLSARQFSQPNLLRTVQSTLAESGLDPSNLELEITESTVMVDVQHTIRTLHELKNIDVHLSIDDFGTGFSSLSYLKQFPIDVLKVDQSFVRDITTDADNAMIVMSVISLAHNLRLQVIAEGVETVEQFNYLKENKCDQVQGYYFSKPLPADKFERFLQQDLPAEA